MTDARPARPAPTLATDVRASALRSIEVGTAALRDLDAALRHDLGDRFAAAVDLILATSGRVIVAGVGKSGHIGRKIAATLASTGTPAFFVHPTEASHGDLGMVTPGDAIIAVSWSGETAELGDLITFSRRFHVPLIALTWNADSTLGRASDIVLPLPKVRESCPHDLAPTSSSLVQLALGDALAVALLERRGFTSSLFKIFHPGGKLAALLKTVDQLMHTGDQIPLVRRGTIMADVLLTMTRRRFGCAGVTADDGVLVGIVTDGDLRRHMDEGLLARAVDDVMTPAPVTVAAGMLASAVVEMMDRKRITAIFVVKDRRPIGIVHVHDLTRAGVI